MGDNLGDRMKRYESVTSTKLTRRTPVMIRIDGRAFHTFTRGFDKPFDYNMIEVMQETALELCKEIGNAKIAYVQSDEISILMTDWDRLETQPWFDNKIQKIVSISSALTTSIFINKWFEKTKHLVNIQFDARCYNIPESEIVNYFIWRQQDWTRNSLQMCARSEFSHNELQGKNRDELMDMLFLGRGFNWNDLPKYIKRGTCISEINGKFYIEKHVPIFTQDRQYIKEHYEVEE